MALKLRKALITEGYLRGLARKSLDEKKLEYFKRQIIAYLESKKDDEPGPDTIEKAVYGIGTIRTWKGKKYIKGADKKWRRFYDKEDRGARISIKNLIKKVDAISSVEELMQLVLLHRDRFQDEYGHPIPIIQELSRYVKERQEKISPVPEPAQPAKNSKNRAAGRSKSESMKGNDNAKKIIIDRLSSNGVQITPQNGKYLFAVGPVEDGYFIINGNLDYKTYDGITKEADKKGLKPPYHIYGGLEVYQDRKNVIFHKIAETLREIEGDKKDSGSTEPKTDTQMKEEQKKEKKARKKAKMPDTGKHDRSSALKDSTWDPKSKDYRYKDTGYIAGSKKELASARIKKAAAAGEQVQNNTIDWEDLEENSRMAETLITKANLFGKVDWEGIKSNGMTGPAGFIINRLYGVIGSKPITDTPDGRFDYSRGLDSIRGRMEACKTLDEVKSVMDEIYEEMNGRFVEAKRTEEYIKMAEKLEKIKAKEKQIIEQVKKESEKRDFFKELNDWIEKTGRRITITYSDIGEAKSFEYYRSEGNPFNNKTFDRLWHEGNSKVRKLKEEMIKESGYDITSDRRKLQDDIDKLLYDKNREISLTNTIGKAWEQLGPGFGKAVAAVRYPGSYKTMGKHLETAEKMAADDWDWAGRRPGSEGEKKERKTQFELKVADNIVRKGGRNINVNTTEELKKAFNLRDVQSGNWVLNDPKSAKFHVDNIAMGLADMGDILEMPDNLLSLNGRLAMAIGARGSGKALAHYEPVERVINITKMKGGGSLGHEWFHALDNLISAAMTGGGDWQTWLTESGTPLSSLNEKQRKLKNNMDYYYRAMKEHPDSEYLKRYYEEAKAKAIKAKVPVFEGGDDDHIVRVKAAFGNLAAAMMNGSADAVQKISFTSKDFEESKKIYFGGWDKLKSVDDLVQWFRSNTWARVRGYSRERSLKLLVAKFLDKPEGGKVEVKTGDKSSAFYRGAQTLDGGEVKYWATLKEMGARAFSAYLQDKLEEKGWENNYLTHATHNADYDMDEGVYPDGDERKAINTAFDELFTTIRETGAIRKAIESENNVKIVFLKKAITIKKHADNDRLEEFKKIILEHLSSEHSENEDELQKAGLPVGTIRNWKGKNYVKIAPGKWRPKYDSHSRGAKMAISSIKKKVDRAATARELMDIVMENRDRFSDAQGNPLPFVQELHKYVEERHEYLPENIAAKRKEARSNAIKAGKDKARGKREAAKRAAEENIRQKAERMKNDDSQDNIDFNHIREKYRGGKSIEGHEDEIYVGDEALKGKWKLVEADAPSASHDETTFHKTRGFPTNKDGSTINDRDYQNDKAAQETVMTMGSNFDWRALSFDSPVVVTQDGIVVSGNNRSMSSKIAARKGADTKYIDALKKRAARFGFSGEDVDGFKHPRVIFEIEKEGGYSTGEFAKYNQESQKTMSPIEAAVKVSKIIKAETVKDIAGHIVDFETMGELYADHKTCINIFNSLENGGIINQFNRNSYIDPDGVITGAGKEFLETVLIGSVVNEQNIRGLNREVCKHIRSKLVRAITPLVNNKAMGGYSIMGELNQAIDLFMQFNIEKDKFGTLEDLVKQGTMFEAPSDVSVELARKMQMNQKDFAEFMQKVNVSLELGASGQSDIFLGDVETKDDILKRFLDIKKSIEAVIRNLRERRERLQHNGNIQKSSGAGEPEAFDVALDFDGVINSYKSGWKGETETDDPVKGAAEGILKLLETGLDIVIYSTRAGSPEGEQTIREYLRELIGEKADTIKITDGKPIAAVYVDDRAVTFSGNWEEMPEKIEKFKSWVDKSLTWSGHKLQGRAKVQGMDVSIENKRGSVRSGTDKDGHDWSIKMNFAYGYIRGTVGKDKDHLDCYLGPNPESVKVFVVHQNDPTIGTYDEDKVMLGFDTLEEAKNAYLSQYDRPGFLGSIDAMNIETFKEKAFDEKNKGKKLE